VAKSIPLGSGYGALDWNKVDKISLDWIKLNAITIDQARSLDFILTDAKWM